MLHFKTNARKSYRQPQCTLQLVYEDRVLFVWVDHVSLCGQQHPNCVLAISLVHPPFFRILRSSSNATKLQRRSKKLYLGNHSELDTCPCKLFCSQWPLLSHPKILNFPHETPCLGLAERAPAISIHYPTTGQYAPASTEQWSGSRVGMHVFDRRKRPSPLHKTELWPTN
jgi:hypothetical protein